MIRWLAALLVDNTAGSWRGHCSVFRCQRWVLAWDQVARAANRGIHDSIVIKSDSSGQPLSRPLPILLFARMRSGRAFALTSFNGRHTLKTNSECSKRGSNNIGSIVYYHVSGHLGCWGLVELVDVYVSPSPRVITFFLVVWVILSLAEYNQISTLNRLNNSTLTVSLLVESWDKIRYSHQL